MPGQIVILNGAPRSGKSSIVEAIQRTFDGPWMNLGVDVFVREVTPPRYRPGMGLRPGEPDHAVAPLVPVFYAALYDSIAAHSHAGLNVVVDVGHYDGAILAESSRRLAGLPVLFVGIRCPIEVIMARRNVGQPGRENDYATGSVAEPVPAPVLRWQDEVHVPGIYDLEVDTSTLSPDQCAVAIRRRLEAGPGSAFAELAGSGPNTRTAPHQGHDRTVMSERTEHGTVNVAMTHRRSKGEPVGTVLKPDPDKTRPADTPAAPPAPEAEPETTEFVERPRKAPDIYISRPELGPKG